LLNASSKARAFSTDEANVNATLHPFFAKISAIPLPMPLEAPVINAVFHCNMQRK
jgi:hypothetical protein